MSGWDALSWALYCGISTTLWIYDLLWMSHTQTPPMTHLSSSPVCKAYCVTLLSLFRHRHIIMHLPPSSPPIIHQSSPSINLQCLGRFVCYHRFFSSVSSLLLLSSFSFSPPPPPLSSLCCRFSSSSVSLSSLLVV